MSSGIGVGLKLCVRVFYLLISSIDVGVVSATLGRALASPS